MNYIIKIILICFILLNLNIKLFLVNSIDPPQSEYNCLKTLVGKFKLSAAFVANSTGGYSFCTNSDVTCYTNGSISELRLDWESTTATTVIQVSDFNCFPFISYLSINKFTISSTLIYTKIQSLKTLVLSGSYGIKAITAQIVKYDRITINSQDFDCTIKMSYLNGIKQISLGGGKITLNTDSLADKATLETFSFQTLNIPNMSGYSNLKYISYSLATGWNSGSASNISTIDCISLSLSFPSTPAIAFPKPFNSSKYSFYNIRGATLSKPSSIIDLSGYIYLKGIQIVEPGTEFHIGGDLPIKLSSNIGLYWTGGSLTKVPSLSQAASYLEITGSTISAALPAYSGTIRTFDFSDNLITGSIGSTWCAANLEIRNNKLTGSLPSCKYCYLNDSAVYSGFTGNSFTNLVTTPTCTTFAPKVSIVKSTSTLFITGTDIGTKPSSYWALNSTLACPAWSLNSFGLNYSCIIPNLSKVEYFWINFKQPNNKNFTFPSISKDPSATSVIINSNKATITGKFFSSYLNYVAQSVTIGSSTCTITSSSFFEIQCTMTTTPANTQLLTITTNALVKKVYIKTTNALLNNKACPNDCSGNSKGVCDLSTGLCQCNTGFALNDCSGYQCSDPTCSNGGQCNLTNGTCQCDQNHQGSICSLPFIQCPSNYGLICSGAGSCNNQTGICQCSPSRSLSDCSGYKCDTQNNCNNNGVCNESIGKCQCNSNWQGIDCSIPFKVCPINSANGLTCSGVNGQCNNQTGICACDSIHQGIDCSIPFKACPIDHSSGLTCSGINGQCNNQTGICVCDSMHQGVSCEYPYLPCENDCSGFGQCDNKTSICTCIQGRIGNDCTDIQCKDPNCGGKGLCDTSTGICSCSFPYFGENCTLIQCLDPSCGNNGNCDINLGQCECEVEWTGDNCNIANHYASSISSTNENGGNVTIYGFFGDEHDSISIKIGERECQLLEIENQYLVCIIGPGQGIQNVTITQNNIQWIGKSFFQYIKDYSSSNECTVLCNLKNGKCNNGICECFSGFKSFDCNSINYTTSGEDGLTNSEISINSNSSGSGSGSVVIQNGSTKFNISIISLVEIDINGDEIIKFNLENNWIFDSGSSNNNIYYFNQQLFNRPTRITLIIEKITNNDIINFANIQYPIEKDSVKVNINISNYQYKSTLNTLELHYKSGSQIADSVKDKCNNNENSNINTLDLESSLVKGSIYHQSFVTIQLQNRVFYSRVIDRALSNGKSTLVTTSIIEKTRDSIILSINLPHGNDIEIDPDFSTLLSTNFIKDCSNGNSKGYIIPISVALPIITVSAISAFSIYYYKRRINKKELNRISVKLSQINKSP